LGVWESLTRDHNHILTSIQLLEGALNDLLKKHVRDLKLHGFLKLREDFVKLFELGVKWHFKIEEEALFPELSSTGGGSKSPPYGASGRT